MGAKIDEIVANRKYIIGRCIFYLVLALALAVSRFTFEAKWQALVNQAAWGTYIPFGLALISAMVALLPLSRLNCKVELFERGFTYGRHSYSWASIRSITWIQSSYHLFFLIPIPFFIYYHTKSVYADGKSVPPMNGLYLLDLHYRFESAFANYYRGS